MINWRRILNFKFSKSLEAIERDYKFSSKPVLIPSEVSYCKMCRREFDPLTPSIFSGYCYVCDTKRAVEESLKTQERLRKAHEEQQERENQRRQKLIDDIAEAVYFKFGATSDSLISQRMIDGARLILRNVILHDEAFKDGYVSNIAMLLHDEYGIIDKDKRNQAAKDILNLLFF